MTIRDQNDGYACVPPRVSGTDPRYAWQSVVTGAAAVSSALFTGLAAAAQPMGKVWVEFEAVTTNAWFRLSRTATTGTTTSNGNSVGFTPALGGTPRRVCYLVDPRVDLYVDVIATGAGVFKWRMCSPEVDRNRQ